MKLIIKRHGKSIGLAVAVAATLLTFNARALDPNTKDARKVIQAMEDKESGDKVVSRVSMVLIDSSGRKRERVLRSRSLDFDAGTKMLMLFESPADMRNTGLLSFDYEDAAKNDDQWLYLPSLRKSTRISTSDKSGSFLGTDITYADMTQRNIDAYEYKMLKDSIKVGNEDCWLIEAKPLTEKERAETGYLKTQTWVSKQKLVPLQAKMWIKEGRKLKYIKFDEIKKIDGIWTTHKLSVRTMKNNKVESTTVMKYLIIKYNDASVKDTDFTERRLEQGL
ncbi:MAG: outer membrane lipoprotein-sorting protein [Proteobacteria bacterium]|nr:outer membrane lipoprotein-sorting protein [Pseudomonadota bacterium]